MKSGTSIELRPGHFRAIFENSAVGIALIGPDGTILAVNRRFAGILAYSQGELVGKTFQEITHPEDLALDLKQAAQLGAGLIESYSMQKRYIRKDGSHVWVLLTGSVGSRGEDGTPFFFLGVVQDITEQKAAEEALARSEARLKTVLEHLPVGVWFTDEKGVILYENPAGQKIWAGARYADSNDEYVAWWYTSRKRIRKDEWGLARAIRNGETSINEVIEIELVDGSRKVIRNSAAPIRAADGSIRGAVAINEDITEEVANEEKLRKAIDSRDEFLSMASHELKTPLTAFQLQLGIRRRYLEKAKMDQFSPDRLHRMLATDEKQIQRLTRLVNDMLDISRLNVSCLTIQREQFCLDELVAEVVERLLPEARSQGCEIKVAREKGVEGSWDYHRVEQILINLLTNAMKFGGGKPIEVELRKSAGEAVLSVRDHGHGIAQEDHERVFGRFERLKPGQDKGGLGLGLYIARQIALLHGGDIVITSELGKGSAFLVRLPLG